MPKLELTDPFIRAHQPAEGKNRIEYYDEKIDGLMLRITSNGAKTFSYRYRVRGKIQRYTIGQYPKVGLGDARRIAKDIAADVGRGEDPQRERVQSRTDLTISDLVEHYREKHLPKLKPSTQTDYWERLRNVILPELGDILARQLTADDILDFLEEIADQRNRPIQSNRCRAVLSSVYSFGQKYRYVVMNPVLTVRPLGEEKQRDRFYSTDEIRRIWQIADTFTEPVSSLIKMLFVTGQRLGETRRMQWNFIKDNIWTIPKELTKANREQNLPLPPLAIDILENLRPYSGHMNHVFHSPIKTDQPITWVQWPAKMIREHENGVPDFRIHDIRRTVASHMAELKIDRTVLGKVLNHKGLAGDTQVTARYDRYDYMREKREALMLWNHKLQGIISPAPEEKGIGATIYRMR